MVRPLVLKIFLNLIRLKSRRAMVVTWWKSLYDEIGRHARLKTLSFNGSWFKSRYRYKIGIYNTNYVHRTKKLKLIYIISAAVVICTKFTTNLFFKIKTESLIWLWALIQDYQYPFIIMSSSNTTYLTVFITNFWTLHLVYVYITTCLLILLLYKSARFYALKK